MHKMDVIASLKSKLGSDSEDSQLNRFHTTLADLIKLVSDTNTYLFEEFGEENVPPGALSIAAAAFAMLDCKSAVFINIVEEFTRRGSNEVDELLRRDRSHFAESARNLVPEVSDEMINSVVKIVQSPSLTDDDASPIFERIEILLKIGLKFEVTRGVPEKYVTSMGNAITKLKM